jgi:hypothetical protein
MPLDGRAPSPFTWRLSQQVPVVASPRPPRISFVSTPDFSFPSRWQHGRQHQRVAVPEPERRFSARARALSLSHTQTHARALSLTHSHKRWRSSSLRDRPSAAVGVCCGKTARILPPPCIVSTPDFSLKQMARNFGQTLCPKPVQQSGGNESKSPLR